MTNSLGQLLITLLQREGICDNNYGKLAEAVYHALNNISCQMNLGDVIELPNGACLTKTYDPRKSECLLNIAPI
jgi:hypothetical protein